MSKVDKNDPPTIIVHGTEDKLVPFVNSEQLIKELELNKVKYELVSIIGAGHTPASHMDKFAKNVAQFLYEIISDQ